MIRCLLMGLMGIMGLMAGCSTTNLSKVLHELKADPATVKFSVMAPGWAVQFERAWPTGLVTRIPGTTLQYGPQYVPPNGLPPVPTR